MRKNRKAWLRIVEAFIAIILIAAVLLLIYSRQIAKPSKEEIIKIQDAILDEIVDNEKLRQDVLNNITINIEAFVEERVPPGLNFSIRICGINDICALSEYRQEVYARERIVSASLKEYSPKKLKLFVWEI